MSIGAAPLNTLNCIGTIERGIFMETYNSCPKCGRKDFVEILECKRCSLIFCQKCKGKRNLPDGTQYYCCPRCGAEIDEDEDTVRVIAKQKK